MGLVDDERVVCAGVPVALDLGEQDAVGHHLDERVVARSVGEPDLVADDIADVDAQLLGDAIGDRSRDAARLGVTDDAVVRRGPARGRSSGSCVVFPDPVSPATITVCLWDFF